VLSDVEFEESADRLRSLIQTGLLTYTDLRDDPERFFNAHRILARHAVEHGPGFWIRFTVQYNLFAGTILAVGGKDQVDAMSAMQEAGQLGCFGLTEKLAGVQSGLVVQTTMEWNQERQRFVLNTPHKGAQKNWISQGYTADKAVVMADLIVGGKSVGPHAFLMDFRNDGSVIDGVELGDMGKKTTGNDLDNAWIQFNEVELPKSALLNRYADIDENGVYSAVEGVAPFAMIGQRLYTGRVAVAQAALSYTRALFERTQTYADNKACWSPKEGAEPMLSNIPQLKAIFEEAEASLTELDHYVDLCEQQLSDDLKSERIPSAKLVEAIATAKVRAVEGCIDLSFRLKQEVGSFALMADAGFAHLDFLQCCKFAEGDSRILVRV
jgi:acyl-CoA oxidase